MILVILLVYETTVFMLVLCVVQNCRNRWETTEGAGVGYSRPGALSLHHRRVSDARFLSLSRNITRLLNLKKVFVST